MMQDLEKLIELQAIDLRIREQEVAQEQFPSMVKELKQAIEKAASTVQNAKAKLEKATADRTGIDEQVRKAQEGLDKSQERLNSIKTNREYDAVHAEIESQKNIINGAETRQKNLDNDIEKQKAILSDAEQEYEKIKTENEPKIAELQSKIDAIDSTIASITEERNKVVPSISKHLMRTYDLIRKKRKTGKAVSMVSNSRTCTVCYKILEPQLYNEIKKSNRIILCQNCGSIMIWEDKSAKQDG